MGNPIQEIVGLDPGAPFSQYNGYVGDTLPNGGLYYNQANRVVVIHSSNSGIGFGGGQPVSYSGDIGTSLQWGLGNYNQIGTLDIYIRWNDSLFGAIGNENGSISNPNNHGLAVDVYKYLVAGHSFPALNKYGAIDNYSLVPKSEYTNTFNLSALDGNISGPYTIDFGKQSGPFINSNLYDSNNHSAVNIDGFSVDAKYLSFDANSDGRSDIIKIWNNNGSANATVVANIPGTISMFQKTNTTWLGGFSTDTKYLASDVDGDGRKDIVEIYNTGSGSNRVSVWHNNGNNTFTQSTGTDWLGGFGNWQYLALDGNGDGKDDIVQIWNNNGSANASVWANVNGKFQQTNTTWLGGFSTDTKYLASDVDGDGRKDIVEIYNTGSGSNRVSVWHNNGNNTFTQSTGTDWLGGFGNWQYLALDGNGDGKDDIVQIWNNNGSANASVWANVNGTFQQTTTTQIGKFSPDTKYLSLDVNNDSFVDIVGITNGTTKSDGTTNDSGNAYANVWYH